MKKTKATEAIKLGLEPLAKEIFRENKDIEEIAKKYIIYMWFFVVTVVTSVT